MAVVLTSNRTSVTQVAGLWSFSETISFTVAYRYASPTPISPSSLATLAGLSCIPTRNDFLFWSRDAFPTQSVVHDVAPVSPLLTGSGESCPEHLPVWIVLPGRWAVDSRCPTRRSELDPSRHVAYHHFLF
jgi:hypothetical protein